MMTKKLLLKTTFILILTSFTKQISSTIQKSQAEICINNLAESSDGLVFSKQKINKTPKRIIYKTSNEQIKASGIATCFDEVFDEVYFMENVLQGSETSFWKPESDIQTKIKDQEPETTVSPKFQTNYIFIDVYGVDGNIEAVNNGAENIETFTVEAVLDKNLLNLTLKTKNCRIIAVDVPKSRRKILDCIERIKPDVEKNIQTWFKNSGQKIVLAILVFIAFGFMAKTVHSELKSPTIIPEKSINIKQNIGNGNFGSVNLAEWKKPGFRNILSRTKNVAVKELITEEAGQQFDILSEINTLISSDNEYIVKFYGLIINQHKIKIVMEYLENGSLSTFMKVDKDFKNSFVITNWFSQIAKGMCYLEAKGIVHRDLAARNVLVKDLNQLKITDFGLAKMVKWGANEKLEDGDDNMAENCQTSETSAILKKHESTENFFSGNKQEKLPLAWLAPECLKSQIFSHKSDVYAYGVTLWEILTFGVGRPWKGYSSFELYKSVVDNSLTLDWPETASGGLWGLMKKCWESDLSRRYSFETILKNSVFLDMQERPVKYILLKNGKDTVWEGDAHGLDKVGIEIVDDGVETILDFENMKMNYETPEKVENSNYEVPTPLTDYETPVRVDSLKFQEQ